LRAISLLSWWKFRNSMRTLFTDPRKLIPAIFLLITLGLWVFGAMVGASQTVPTKFSKTVDPQLAEAAMFLILILDSFMVIDTGLGEGLLAFGMSDVDYLFPSPISRRTVLAYRLPALAFTTFFSTGMALYLMQMVGNLVPLKPGPVTASTGIVPLAVLLCIGIWMNLALYIAVRFPDRRKWRRIEGYTILAFIGVLALIFWQRGMDSAASAVLSPVLRVIFFPCTLAANVVVAANAHQPLDKSLIWLALGYVVTLIPAFSSNANWYEQSIVSSERVAAIRTAAKGGMASAMAAQAARSKYKVTKTYTVKPFGEGAMALVWAHLCAAAKRPWTNFVGPAIAGIAVGAWGSIAGIRDVDMATGLAFPMILYSAILFMGSAKTASEAAIRRRELLAPLPISGWQSVAANLAPPGISVLLFCWTGSLIYGAAQGPYWAYVVFAAAVLYPIRLAARMVLQYAQVLAHPDLADKVQQFLSQGVYYALALPLVIIEVIVCMPALFLKSWWLALICLTVLQVIFLAVLFKLTGKASERSIATGEPISLWRMVRGKA